MLKWTEGSDYVRRYRALDASGAAAPTSWSLLPSELPLAATSRLGMFNLTPSDLSPFALQALAWDLGLVAVNRSGTFSWAQVFVKRQGDSMADIAATFDSFTTSPTQTTRECVGGPNGKYLRQERTEYSTFYAKVTKCAVEVLDDVPDGLSAMLAQDALATTDVPSPLLRRHEGPGVGETNMAIHTSPNFGRWPWGECPPSNQPAGLIIPCDFNVKTALLPASSPAMDGWLQDIATRKIQVAATTAPPPPLNPTALPAVNPSAGTSSRPVQATPTVAYVGSGLGLVALVLLVWWCRRRYRRAHPRPLDFEPYLELTATPKGVPPPPPALSPVPSFSLHAVPLTRPMRRRFEGPPPLPPLDSSMILLRLDVSKRLDFGTIECVEVLASGPVTSVYFGYYHARPVAIKALSTSVEINQVQVDTFIEEIRLMASFNHPNIVELVGYAWQDGDPRSLVAVTEYLSQGNLLDFLIAHPGLEFWSRGRTRN
ncbi:hypothetical protein H310_09291 [Aphanomyces invadans]|uniref:Protein kinase domain-containing protein n=1 Tax=Aphanomyces invadans TaxID=157072 RepID=A0A024TXD0_9STRA|nr:hypothetical protein H310_09291 [Aphanomyces invadans]ETV97987.1 hypothetical protein H310_09291 [Aphanomyces invadans]|eukprot:XP_008873548.1 hypothetical protein H310_09291 [Aphanomyces invadans]